MFQTAQDAFWLEQKRGLSSRNILKPIVRVYKSKDFNTHNKQILCGQCWVHIISFLDGKYNTNMRVFTSTVLRSAHSERDI